MASIASALQYVQTTIKDPLKATPQSSGIRSAFGALALGLATAAGTIGVAALARKTGASFEPADNIGAQASAQPGGAGGKPGTIAGGPEPAGPEPGTPPGARRAQGVLLIAAVSVFALSVIIWAARRKKGT